jgi:hypothetical protein
MVCAYALEGIVVNAIAIKRQIAGLGCILTKKFAKYYNKMDASDYNPIIRSSENGMIAVSVIREDMADSNVNRKNEVSSGCEFT